MVTIQGQMEILPRAPIGCEAPGRLFERFARSDSANVGSGLGLAIAHAYARAHGGDLIYDPTASGARFELIIPQA